MRYRAASQAIISDYTWKSTATEKGIVSAIFVKSHFLASLPLISTFSVTQEAIRNHAQYVVVNILL